MRKENIAGSAMLVLTALIWGGAFVAQSTAMDHIGALTFNAVRFYIGALVLLPVIAFMDAGRKRRGVYEKPTRTQKRYLWISGVLCGLALGCATLVQQYAIVYTTVGKAGFITALYIVLVPIFSIFFGKKPAPALWLCVAVAAAGLYFLCMTESFTISLGDGLAIVCSALFALQIMLVSHFGPGCDSVRLSCIQFFVAGTLAGVLMLLFEEPTAQALWDGRWPILYTGVLSSGVAYTLQVVGQKRTNPVLASLLMSLESVFASLFGALILHQIPSGREITGCVLMFGAIILAQVLPAEKNAPQPAKTKEE